MKHETTDRRLPQQGGAARALQGAGRQVVDPRRRGLRREHRAGADGWVGVRVNGCGGVEFEVVDSGATIHLPAYIHIHT